MQYRWCTGKRGSGIAPDWPREDSSSRGLVVVMAEAVATAVALALFYAGWRWVLGCIHDNRLERRHLYDPPTGGPWVRPRGLYEDLPH